MNTHIIDVFDEIVLTLLKPRNLFSDAMLQTTLNRRPAQQSERVCLTFLFVLKPSDKKAVANIFLITALSEFDRASGHSRPLGGNAWKELGG
jgi:hypothetical protein